VGTPTCHHISFPYSVLCFTSQLSFLCLHTNPHNDPDNSNFTTTARHSLAPSIPTHLRKPYGPFQGPSKRDYIRATPTSSDNQPMTEQTGQQATGIKRGHSDQQNSFIRKGHIKTEDTTPECPAMKPRGPGTPPLIQTFCSSTQHQSQPPQFHCGPPASQSRSQRYIIACGRPEASSLHGNPAIHRSRHSTADKTKSREVSHKRSQARLYYARH